MKADLMTVDEAAIYLGMSAAFLNKLRSLGGGPTYAKFGRLVRYMAKDLDAWVEASKRTIVEH